MEKIKEKIEALKQKLNDRDNETAETIKAATDEMQQASLKLFEMAYKKAGDK